MNADVPIFDAWLRAEFLHDLDESRKGQHERCTVFGLTSLQGRALGFHVLVHGTGAVIGRLPLSALVTKEDAPEWPLDWHQLWDAFSYAVHVHEFGHLSNRRCQVIVKDGSKHLGNYRFTVDWHGNNESENAGETGWKNAHIIELDNGCLVGQPNNRILWADPATITRPFSVRPDYKTMSHTWSVEGVGRWATEDSDKMFYETVETEISAPESERNDE